MKNNAIIMAAGFGSRFAPLSFVRHKGLLTVRGENLTRRQILQLRHAGVEEIVIVTGHLSEQFAPLIEEFGLIEIKNPDYLRMNNFSSLYHAREYLRSSYVLCVDNYLLINPYSQQPHEHSWYTMKHSNIELNEYICELDASGRIVGMHEFGAGDYVMGTAYFSEEFSREFVGVLERAYADAAQHNLLWEHLLERHLAALPPMYALKCKGDEVMEFDNLDELREFDESYRDNTGDGCFKIIKDFFKVSESDIRRCDGKYLGAAGGGGGAGGAGGGGGAGAGGAGGAGGGGGAGAGGAGASLAGAAPGGKMFCFEVKNRSYLFIIYPGALSEAIAAVNAAKYFIRRPLSSDDVLYLDANLSICIARCD